MASSDRLYRELGALIKRKRDDVGLTQTQLAQQVGLTRTSITNIESGRQKIQIHVLYDIAKVLNVNPSELLPSLSPTPKDNIRAKLLKGIQANEREWIKKVIGESGGDDKDE